MKNLFNSIQLQKPKTNLFDLSHDVKLSLRMGDLVPIMCEECVPGDKWNISCESLLRFAPLVSPVMHRMDVTMHYFFVPNRLLWDEWEKWITRENVQNFPHVRMDSAKYTELADYMGIPNPIGANAEDVNAMPFAAYQFVVNEMYRDQNLMAEIPYKLNSGDNTLNTDLTTLRKRCWEHDYFTAALPTPQQGATVDIPLGEVQLDPEWSTFNIDPANSPRFTIDGAQPTVGAEGQLYSHNGVTEPPQGNITIAAGGAGNSLAYDPQGSLIVEPTTINDLRRAFKLQEWLERNMRGGKRYIESILSHFGVRSSDARLQRPEYITGTKSPVIISEVLNTTGTEDAPQGNMAGHGVSVTSGKYGNYRCEEHGFIIGIMSVLPKTAYQQGLDKKWLKTQDPFQYYWPAFANIGEQEVLNKEVYAFQGTAGLNTFGYVPRYAEYKFAQNRVAGDFRGNLDFWHMGRIFSTPPALNENFVKADPTERIFAVTDPTIDKLYAHVYNKIKAVRPMPKFGTPMF